MVNKKTRRNLIIGGVVLVSIMLIFVFGINQSIILKDEGNVLFSYHGNIPHVFASGSCEFARDDLVKAGITGANPFSFPAEKRIVFQDVEYIFNMVRHKDRDDCGFPNYQFEVSVNGELVDVVSPEIVGNNDCAFPQIISRGYGLGGKVYDGGLPSEKKGLDVEFSHKFEWFTGRCINGNGYYIINKYTLVESVEEVIEDIDVDDVVEDTTETTEETSETNGGETEQVEKTNILFFIIPSVLVILVIVIIVNIIRRRR